MFILHEISVDIGYFHKKIMTRKMLACFDLIRHKCDYIRLILM